MNENISMGYYNDLLRMLKRIERTLDEEHTDLSNLTAESLKIPYVRWVKYLQMLIDAGYITGITIKDFEEEDIKDRYGIDMDNISITIKGMEYLAENTVIANAYKTIKGIKDIIN